MISPKIPLAQEGFPFIALSAFFTLITAILGYEILAWPALLVTCFVVAFFRDPERMTDASPDKILSPADGKVILIEEQLDHTYLDEQVIKISIFMNVFNVHVNRIPIEGTIESIHYKPGKFYSADSKKGALQNERCGIILQCESGQKIAFVQVAGLIARRIVNWLEPTDTVQRGERFGLIRFGSRVDIYLPLNSVIDVQVGQKVTAGKTSLASFT